MKPTSFSRLCTRCCDTATSAVLTVLPSPCILRCPQTPMQASYEEKETGHRVIVGREYYEPFGLEPQEVVGRAITHLIRKKVPRQTEGVRRPQAV